MAVKRLKPKNDFIFQRLFGEVETKDSLIALLNAILRLEGAFRIVDLTVIENKQLAKELIDDKTGRLDVRAETADSVQVDIEVQLTDQRNMTKRSLFYLSKLFVESIKAGGKYEDLKKTVAINILDFNLLDIARFHSTFHFYEDHEPTYMLTDVLEMHFIEYPKFREVDKNFGDPLHRWLLFLDEKLPEDQLKELVSMDPVIKKAEERLEWLSSDEETLRLYEAREFSRIERNSLISEAKAAGRAEGKAEGKAEIASQMLREGLEVSLIAKLTGLSLDKIERIRRHAGPR
jgi:predicted transposase/invertase (TIGR01784 family)